MTDIADEWSLMDVFGPSAKRRQLRLVLGVLGAMALLGSLRTPSPMAAKEPTASDIHDITDEEYYAMPQMYELDEYYGCLVRGGVYCFGLFQLEAPPGNELFHMIQHYSEDRVRHSDHSQLYRGFCLPRRCPHDPGKDDRQWFASCVNSTLISEYGVSAELKRLEYCTRELQGRTLTAKGVLFIGFVVVLAIAATITTILDLKLSDESKKDAGWMLSWSVLRSWRSLTQPVQTAGTDLRFLDGLRAISMMILMLLHAAIYSILSVADTRVYEQSKLYMTMSNLTLAVQVFFIISSFLMAHKVLQKENIPAKINFVQTMQNRIVRILPTLTVWILYMSTLHEYFGSGPAWKWGVRNEVETCQQSWWMNVLFVNNFNNQVKCQKQTWYGRRLVTGKIADNRENFSKPAPRRAILWRNIRYLAADMQLYVAMLALTLLLRGRRALPILSALLAAATTLSAVIAYAWNLMPSYAIHSPDNYRGQYTDVATFNLLYQSPWGNAFASLTGLLLAHAHHALKISKYDLRGNQAFQWASKLAGPAVLLWIVTWPCIHPQGTISRLKSAMLSGLIGPVFCLLIAVIIMEMLQGGNSPLRRLLSTRMLSVLARLSLSVLLVHFPLAKVQLAVRDWAIKVDYINILFNAFGVWAMSYALAVALALLVELPTQRLYRELSGAVRIKRNA